MNANFFNFMQVPECILKKNFNRKQFDTVIKLLSSVKDAYLKERVQRDAELAEKAKKEAEFGKDYNQQKKNDDQNQPRADPNMITEEDMIEISLLDIYIS